VRVQATSQAIEFIREHGGRLNVWVSGAACCGGTRFIESSTEPPPDDIRFLRVDHSEFELYVRPAGDQLPDELHVDLKGRRRPRVEAYWNGCAYLV
jgi:hypothetical protein